MDITCKHRIENKHESGHSSQKLGSLCRPQTSCMTHVLITLCRFWPVNYIFWPKEMYVIVLYIYMHKQRINDGYPKKFINSAIQHTLHTQPQRENTDKYVYIPLLINEELKRRALSIVRRTGLENIRLHFDKGPSLSKIFAPRKEKLSCSDNCDTCKLAIKANLCKIKNTIYLINCLHCHLVYVGETGRTIRSRIKEHLRMDKQTIHVHLIRTHNFDPQSESTLSWKILHSNINYLYEREVIEALEIRNYCAGRNINI